MNSVVKLRINMPLFLALRQIRSLRRFSTYIYIYILVSTFTQITQQTNSNSNSNSNSYVFISFAVVTEEDKSNSTKSSFIHPSAIVHPNADLGKGVSVGPFCTIGPSAKLGNLCQLYPGSHVLGNTELGDNCTLMVGAVVGDDLPGCTVIGCNNVVGHHAVVGIRCQDIKYKLGNDCFLEIGDNNEIREFASIHRSSTPSERTVIGDNNLIMGSCHIAHDCKVGNNNIFANNTMLAGHVIVEDYAHTAGAIAVHQFCHIGSFSFIGGGSVIRVTTCLLILCHLGTTENIFYCSRDLGVF